MSAIIILSITDDIKEVAADAVALENELQTLIEQSMDTFFSVIFSKSEYKITNARITRIRSETNGQAKRRIA
jgi:hypothetical protein